jgi:hypothetical protein
MTERWTDERLDKMADTLNQTIEAIGHLGQRTEVIATAVERLTDVQLQTFRVIEEMQQEVRGLQTENRSIFSRLFGEE